VVLGLELWLDGVVVVVDGAVVVLLVLGADEVDEDDDGEEDDDPWLDDVDDADPPLEPVLELVGDELDPVGADDDGVVLVLLDLGGLASRPLPDS
jgi:hypothetical protein